MNEIKSRALKPIETIYNGYRFRSRLEARWAVFFDAMGIKYEYEQQGFELSDGTRYLPDFLLYVRHRSYDDEYEPVYAEVKGEMTFYDLHKIELFAENRPIIVLGNLPKDNNEYLHVFFDGEGKYEGVFHSYCYIDGDDYPAFFAIYNGEPWICGGDHDQWDCGKSMDAALLKARQARFEHGETPQANGGIT